jgi:predicted enzyme related to lactoylglutathione lyase
MTDPNVGRFVWHDLLTENVEASIAFYKDVVGWTTQPFEKSYTMWVSSQGPLGGVMKLPDEAKKMGARPHWTSYVCVADCNAIAKKAKELGGKLYVEPTDIPKVGRFANIADPQGAFISILQPSESEKLHDSTKPGEFTWGELMTTDHEAAFRFYSTLFGWKKNREHDMGAMGKYLIYGVGDKDLGGMMTKPKDAPMPNAFTYYIEIANLDAALARAKARDARVLNGPMEVPGGARIVQLMDPQGAAIALHEIAKK